MYTQKRVHELTNIYFHFIYILPFLLNTKPFITYFNVRMFLYISNKDKVKTALISSLTIH